MTDDGAFLVAEVRRALAENEHIGELGIDLVVEGASLVLAGPVESYQRRTDIELLVRRLAPEHVIINRITVLRAAAPGEPEEIS